MSTLQSIQKAPTRIHPFRAVAVCLLGAGIVATIPWVDHAYLYSLVTLFFGCVIGPMAFDWYHGRLDYFEPIHVIGVISFMYFGLGSIWTAQNPSLAFDIHAVEFIPRATLYCLIGYIALLMAYYGPWAGKQSERPREEVLRGSLFLIGPAMLGWVGYIAYAQSIHAPGIRFVLPAFVSSLSQLAPLFLFAWALAWLLFFSGRMTQPQRMVLFLGMLPGALFIAFQTFTNKSLVITLIGIPMIAMWYARRRVPWRMMLILLIVLIFVVFPFYNTFRTIDPNMSQTRRLEATYNAVNDWNFDHYWTRSLVSFQARIALINSVAVVLRDTGRWVPYAHGETIFLPAIGLFIPRFIWPDKPSFTSGRDFGVTFRLVNPLDKNTNIAATVPGELYWNFDLPGIVIGMALWGLAMRALYRRYGEAQSLDPVRRAIHIVVLVQLAYLGEGHVSGHGVILIRTLILFEMWRLAGRHWGLLASVAVKPAR